MGKQVVIYSSNPSNPQTIDRCIVGAQTVGGLMVGEACLTNFFF